MNNTSVKSLIGGMTTAASAFVLVMQMDNLETNDYLPHKVPRVECCVPDDYFKDPHYEAVANRFREENSIKSLVSSKNFEKDIQNWFSYQKSSPHENIRYRTTELLEALLSAEDINKSRLLLEIAATHFPDDQSFRSARSIIAPAKIVSTNKSEIEGFQETIQFFRNSGTNFERKWIAVSMGQLLGVSDSYKSLAEKFSDNKNVFISKIV